jgi:polysaccharide export outer membrane protein
LLLVVGLALSAVQAQVAGSTPDLPPAASPETLLIGPGDLLHVTIFRENDLEQKVRVKDSGDVLLQLVGMVNV